ncbi:hypothetical protein IJG91_01935 [Candidatus Saccharibacteria bacterium]|nr:hypothetical protein [Candidatus Saccharibacteria bacterium]MBQ3352399.1 hypothetical protein [Candidatus Saccharibacteria bacterium]
MDLGFYLAAICCVLISALQADTASKTEGNRAGGIGIKGYIGYIVIGIALAFLAAISKVVALIIVFAIGILAIMNKEGVHRSYSWVALLVLNGAMMLMAIARGWDKTGPKFSELKLLLFPLFFIVIAVTVGRYREISATS